MEGKELSNFEFGEFKLDSRRRTLTKSGEKVPLSARNFDLLLFMVENGGRILEHDELLDKVWAGTFVEQATLKKGISALRHILDEKPETEFIKTIPRRGYSFVSPVRAISEQNENFYVRETEREIIVEEYIEIDDGEDEINETGQIIEIQTAKVLPSSEKKTNKFTRTAILIGAGVCLVILAFFGLKTFFTKKVQAQFSAENVRVTRLTNTGKVVSGAVASADGNYILYPTYEKEGAVLWLRQILATDPKKLISPVKGGFYGFAIAPDNSFIYYLFNNPTEPSKSGLYKIPFLGGEPQRIAENSGTMAISPDSKKILVARGGENTSIYSIDTNGEGEQLITTIPGEYRLWSLRWTPDGNGLLYTVRKTVDSKMLFYVAELDLENGKETIILPPQERVVYGAEWLPDKSALLLVVRETNADIRQIWQYFPSTQEWRRITNDNNSYNTINLTRDGKNIISSQGSRLASIWLSDGKLPDPNSVDKKTPTMSRDNFRQITDGISSYDRLGWLADNRLFYSTTEDGKETIFTINPDGTNIRQITNGQDGIWITPTVTGNNQNIAYLSTRDGVRQVWRIDSEGKNPLKMTEISTPLFFFWVSKDNLTVLFSSQTTADGSCLFKQTNGQITKITDSDTGLFAVSSDEKLLAVEVLDKNTRKFHVELRSLEDGKTIKTFEISPDRQLSFTPDGKNLAYDSTTGETSQIMIQPFDGEPYSLTNFQTDKIFSFCWSPDGSRLAVIRGKQMNDAVLIKANDRE